MTTSLGLKIGSTTCVAVPGTDDGLDAAALLAGEPHRLPELAQPPRKHRIGPPPQPEDEPKPRAGRPDCPPEPPRGEPENGNAKPRHKSDGEPDQAGDQR